MAITYCLLFSVSCVDRRGEAEPAAPGGGALCQGKRQGCGSDPFSAGSGFSKLEFKIRILDPTGTYQESIQTSNFFHISQISSDILMMIIFS